MKIYDPPINVVTNFDHLFILSGMVTIQSSPSTYVLSYYQSQSLINITNIPLYHTPPSYFVPACFQLVCYIGAH